MPGRKAGHLNETDPMDQSIRIRAWPAVPVQARPEQPGRSLQVPQEQRLPERQGQLQQVLRPGQPLPAVLMPLH